MTAVKANPEMLGQEDIGGEGGIRTLDTGLPYTHFPGVLLQPLGHLSGDVFSGWWTREARDSTIIRGKFMGWMVEIFQ